MEPYSQSAREWLECLPKGYRERAFANTPAYRLSLRYHNLAHAIDGVFDWNESPEGREFWHLVCECCKGNRRKMPPFPAPGIAVKAERKRRQMSREAFAALTGIPSHALFKIETGTRSLTRAEAAALWLHTGLNPESLTNEPPKS